MEAVIVFHDSRCTEYARARHPERPQRITNTVPLLQTRHPDWEWHTPHAATEEILLHAHSREHLARIKAAAQDFDVDTPAYKNIFEHAARSASAAVEVAREVMTGNRTFSLMRPPGHHATRDQAMGFCYFSNVAIAALNALEEGAGRVAIWDFDAHHGNGTEAIVAHNPRIAFASIHQFPAYPGTGQQSFANIHNFPVAPFSTRETHTREVERGLETLLAFKPDLLLVSAGFDAYSGDPLTQMSLAAEDFGLFGNWLRQAGMRAGAILEGGYSDDLPELIDGFLSGWNC